MKVNLDYQMQQKCLPFMATLYMTLMVCSTVLGNKLVLTYFGVLSAASFVSPLWYILGDIITEQYGYKTSKNLFWSVMICQFIFSLACYFLIELDSPVYWNGEEGFRLVLGECLRFTVVNFIGITIAWHINAKLLTRWKILMSGKYFWLRSIGSSGIGLIIYSMLSITVNVYGSPLQRDVISIVLGSCLLKIIYLVLLAYPAVFVVALLARIENKEFLMKDQIFQF